MAKLFIFAIGGTGSRVVKALTMLLASGVKIENTQTIIPIIIDPDIANGDLTRTEEIIRLYKKIHQKSLSKESFFFKTPYNSLGEITKMSDNGDDLEPAKIISDQFRFEIEGVKDNLFRDFIGFSELSKTNKAFISLLFSKDNLDADMDMGFKGNPNIGSVVLNKFRESDCFHEFAQSFGENDRVFIISSIFGGTGAAGFPMLLKNIRGAQYPVPNHANLRKAKIGAVSILPYFSINDTGKKTVIDSNTFISKTKAALNYYSRNVSGNSSLDSLYYIGDQFVDNRVEGADGAADQKNNAHFIEMASALAIIDFMSKSDESFSFSNGSVSNPEYNEYGLKADCGAITFKELCDKSHDIIAIPLTQYTLFELFFKHYFDEFSNKVFAENGNNKLIKAALEPRFTDELKKFNTHFEVWLAEMAKSTVSFNAINHMVSRKDILNLVIGSPEKTSWNPLVKKGLEAYLEELAKTDEKENYDALGDSNKKLLATFANATNNVIINKIGL